jgi:hypothetical protein
MSLLGRGFLGIWHNVEPSWRDEYDAWHTIEHMPERLGIPGFLRGRRFIDYSLAPHVCFTLYEGSHSETFRSPGYLARLNAPTEWSLQVQPHMPDFVRGAFVPLVSLGEGVGGAMATFRIVDDSGDANAIARALTACAHELKALPGVCGVHVGQAQTDVASAPTAESKLRGGGDSRTDDFVVLVEGIASSSLSKQADAMRKLIGEAGNVRMTGDVYPLAYSLTSNGQ